jgi:hypothetical protein
MTRLFPDVAPGDSLIGTTGQMVPAFLQRQAASARSPTRAFAERFFAIWLDPKTSAPELRVALLNAAEG